MQFIRARVTRVAAVVVASAVLAGACGSADSESAMLGLLGDLPTLDAERDNDFVSIALIDWERSAVSGAWERPNNFESEDDVRAWLDILEEPDVAGIRLAETSSSGVTAGTWDRAYLWLDRIGTGPPFSDRYASLGGRPDGTLFLTMTSVSELPGDLEDLGGNVFGLGSGEENVPNVADTDELRTLGRPLRFALEDDQLAVAQTEATTRRWLAGERLDGDPALSALARELDRVNTDAAVLWITDFGAADGEQAVSDRPFDAVGLGFSFDPDGVTHSLVYHFESESDAEASVQQLSDAWGSGRLDDFEMSDFVELVSVEQAGSVVTVRTRPAAEGGLGATTLFINRTWLLRHG